jgi:hypothetical protein
MPPEPHIFGQINQVERQQAQLQQVYISVSASVFQKLAATDYQRAFMELQDAKSIWENRPVEKEADLEPKELRLDPVNTAAIAFHYADAYMARLTEK